MAEGALHIWERHSPDDRAEAIAKAGAAWSRGEGAGGGWGGAHRVAFHAPPGQWGGGDCATRRRRHAAGNVGTRRFPAARGIHGAGAGLPGSRHERRRRDQLRSSRGRRCPGVGRSAARGLRGSSGSTESGNRWARRSCWNRSRTRRAFARWWPTARSRRSRRSRTSDWQQQGVIGELASWPAGQSRVCVRTGEVRGQFVGRLRRPTRCGRHASRCCWFTGRGHQHRAATFAGTARRQSPGNGVMGGAGRRAFASLGMARAEYVRRVTAWFETRQRSAMIVG